MSNVLEWTKDTLKDGVELWNDEKIINQNGATLKRSTRRLREICLGVISANTAEEWYRICRLNAPAGTIIEPFIEDLWIELFNDTTALVRNELTKCLLKERAAKSAQTLLGILERRDKPHWSKEQKETKVSATTADGTAMNVTFSIME